MKSPSVSVSLLSMLLLAGQGSGEHAHDEGAKETQPVRFVDDFDGKATLEWTIRNPDPERFAYIAKPGTLTITTQPGGMFRVANDCKNLFLLPNPLKDGKDFEVTTCIVDFQPTATWQQAGLVCFDDEDNYIKFVIQHGNETPPFQLALIRETKGIVAPGTQAKVVLSAPPARIWLRLTKWGHRYAFASSTDGKQFRIHGELPWEISAPQYLGLVAKNGSDGTEASVDASFDSFELRERLPEERPIMLYSMPSGTVEDLFNYLVALRSYRPQTSEDVTEYNRRAPSLLRLAATSIMRTEKDPWSKAYQTALLVMLEERVRLLPNAPRDQQEQTAGLVRTLLAAKIDEGKIPIEEDDIQLCFSTGAALEKTGNLELAAKTYRSSAELIAKEGNKNHTEALAVLQGAARRVALIGERLDFETFAASDARWDTSSYTNKNVLLLFWSSQVEPSLLELRRAKMLYSLYHDRGFEVLAVCVDPKSEIVKRLVEQGEFPWTTLVSESPEAKHPLAIHYGVTSTPAAILVDGKGTVVSVRPLAEELERCLAVSLGQPYTPQGELIYLDVRTKANQKLSEKLHNLPDNDLRELPTGEQTFAGVKFSITDALMQLSGQGLKGRPEKIEGVAVGSAVHRLYFLHGTGARADDGSIIGKYVVHYEGGAVEAIPIVYGVHVRNWETRGDLLPVDQSVIAWTGLNDYARRLNTVMRLYLTEWNNPRPEERITSIDFVSTETTAFPFCIAITAERCTSQ
jgi:regulation of enolase protein 1 (concanavalin A-like superfamily)